MASVHCHGIEPSWQTESLGGHYADIAGILKKKLLHRLQPLCSVTKTGFIAEGDAEENIVSFDTKTCPTLSG